MHKESSMKLSIIFTTLGMLAIPAIASAHGGNSDPNVVHACIGNVSKVVRIVGASGSCITSPPLVAETAAHWDLQGAPGINGVDGTSVRFVNYFAGIQNGCPNGGAIYATGNPAVNSYVCNGANGSGSPSAAAVFAVPGDKSLVDAGYTDTGVVFTEQWRQVNAFPPHVLAYRNFHTAVWTGSRMLVWGGVESTSSGHFGVNTGYQYFPGQSGFITINANGAPSARYQHTAVWTGSQMIVWGGREGNEPANTGGRYDPSTNAWTATSTVGAPCGRAQHTAVWTGARMIVWGGYCDTGFTDTGAMYDPITDSWTPLPATNAPSARAAHTAVWTGNSMVIFGGSDNLGEDVHPFNTGATYVASTNSWLPTPVQDAPSARFEHTAVWTGQRMVIWGGFSTTGIEATGALFDPVTQSWAATSPSDVPARTRHTAIWTGSRMLIWGGVNETGALDTGAFYDPGRCTIPLCDSWTPISTADAPSPRYGHTAIWTGSRMVIWGGSDGFTENNIVGGEYLKIDMFVKN
jgi:N-acetylneuraminic acid mutarotase